MRFVSTLVIFLTCWSGLAAQSDTIHLRNPSFEDIPRQGGQFNIPIRGWFDCSRIHFPRETPPDIHPVNFWSVTSMPSEGETYLGLVVRYNDSWEAVAQRLESPIIGGNCYSFAIDLSVSEVYLSPTHVSEGREENFTEPAVLRVWGGQGICDRGELLAESTTVTNSDWSRYYFEFRPKRSHRFIILEAFYKTPALFLYNGHILADDASSITRITCPDEEPAVVVVKPSTRTPEKPAVKRTKPKPDPVVTKPVEDIPARDIVSAEETPRVEEPVNRLMEQLDRSKLRKGQTIRIKNLYFKADTSSINEKSFEVLNEIFGFLEDNKDIIVEIGGHTNGLPKHDYCDELSTARASAVAEYLIRRGISPNRVRAKGYGKRKPIASNQTREGRAKNQRVEIKILSMG